MPTLNCAVVGTGVVFQVTAPEDVTVTTFTRSSMETEPSLSVYGALIPKFLVRIQWNFGLQNVCGHQLTLPSPWLEDGLVLHSS